MFCLQEIKNATAIPETDLQRNLQSLACAKYKILKKHPAGRDVNPTDSFSFNSDFSAPLQKIKISTVAARVESTDERKETKDRVEEERRHQTEVSRTGCAAGGQGCSCERSRHALYES